MIDNAWFILNKKVILLARVFFKQYVYVYQKNLKHFIFYIFYTLKVNIWDINKENVLNL